MSFGNTRLLSGVQEALSIALTIITILVLFYGGMDFTYKFTIVVFSFALLILINVAAVYLKLQKEQRDQQIRQA